MNVRPRLNVHVAPTHGVKFCFIVQLVLDVERNEIRANDGMLLAGFLSRLIKLNSECVATGVV